MSDDVLFHEQAMRLDEREALAYLNDAMSGGLNPRTDDGMQKILYRASVDQMFFAQTFLAATFFDEMTDQQRQAWAILQNPRIARGAVCAWRGFGKSAGMKASCIHGVCFRSVHNILWVGSSLDSAIMETENIKEMLFGEGSELIEWAFGIAFVAADSEEGQALLGKKRYKRQFSRKTWFVIDKATAKPFAVVTPKGAGQNPRGLNVVFDGRIYRPDFICIDDLEEDEAVKNEQRRKSLRQWFEGALSNVVYTRRQPDPATHMWTDKDIVGGAVPWRILYCDTVKHVDANIMHILDDDTWVSVRLPMAELRKDPDGVERYYSLTTSITDAQVRAEARRAEKIGTLDVFFREKMCVATTPDEQRWTKSMFLYYSENDKNADIQRNQKVDRFIIVDPAKTTSPQSAYSAALAVAANVETGRIYFRQSLNRKLKPDELVDEVFLMAQLLNTRVIAIEITGIENFATHFFQNEASKRGLPLSFMWLEARGVGRDSDFGTGREAVKRARAGQINPYYERGCVYHEESLRGGAMESQMLSYPNPANWDALDCAGYVPQVLSKLGRYFVPQIQTEANTGFYDGYEDEDITSQIQGGMWHIAHEPGWRR